MGRSRSRPCREIHADNAVTTPFRRRPDLPRRIGQRRGADVIRGAMIVGQRRQFGQQPRIVGGVVALFAGVASGVNARPAAHAGTTKPLSSPRTHSWRCVASSTAFFRAFSSKVLPSSITSGASG